jgi:uncharacterized membrane protein
MIGAIFGLVLLSLLVLVVLVVLVVLLVFLMLLLMVRRVETCRRTVGSVSPVVVWTRGMLPA